MNEKLYDPWKHARALGIQVIHRDLKTLNGLWVPDYKTIVLRREMQPWAERSTLAHEIGHALLGHRESNPENEFEANRVAMSNLIRGMDTRSLTDAVSHQSGMRSEAARRLRVTSRMLCDMFTPLDAEATKRVRNDD